MSTASASSRSGVTASPPEAVKFSGVVDRPAGPSVIRGRHLGRYALRFHVASGGMGAVYLADFRSGKDFRKWVAVKVIHTDVAQSRKFVEMFRREARIAAQVVDPYVCQVFDFGEAEGSCYLAMEYLHGQPLSTIAERASRKGGLAPVLAARVVADAARGLHALHTLRDADGSDLSVVHRDVSPQNLFVLYTGVTKILDFGIARPAEQEGEFTRTGEIKGKPAYLAPEQARGEPVTPRVDLWALGVVLWEITLGRRLFRRGSDAESLAAVLHDAVPLPTSLRASYPAELETIIMRALTRDASERYASGLDLARDLEAFVQNAAGANGHDAVAEHLAAHFENERAEREALLRDRPDSVVPLSPEHEVGPHGLTSGLRLKQKSLVPLLLGVALTSVLAAVGISYALKRHPTAAPGGERPAVVPPMAAPMTARQVTPQATPAPTAASTGAAGPGAPQAAPVAHQAAAPTAPGHAQHPGPQHPRPGANTGASVNANAAPAAAPRTAPMEGWGHLTLNAPPATVFLGSRQLGHTPLYEVSLPAGEHTIRVVPDDGSAEHETQLVVESGATTALRMRW